MSIVAHDADLDRGPDLATRVEDRHVRVAGGRGVDGGGGHDEGVAGPGRLDGQVGGPTPATVVPLPERPGREGHDQGVGVAGLLVSTGPTRVTVPLKVPRWPSTVTCTLSPTATSLTWLRRERGGRLVAAGVVDGDGRAGRSRCSRIARRRDSTLATVPAIGAVSVRVVERLLGGDRVAWAESIAGLIAGQLGGAVGGGGGRSRTGACRTGWNPCSWRRGTALGAAGRRRSSSRLADGDVGARRRRLALDRIWAKAVSAALDGLLVGGNLLLAGHRGREGGGARRGAGRRRGAGPWLCGRGGRRRRRGGRRLVVGVVVDGRGRWGGR